MALNDLSIATIRAPPSQTARAEGASVEGRRDDAGTFSRAGRHSRPRARSADASKSSRRRIGRPREGARGGGADADGTSISAGGRTAGEKKTNPDGTSVGVDDDVSSSPRDGVAGMPRVSASRDRSSRKANGDAIRSWLKDASAAGPEDEARRDLDGRDDSVPRGRRGARRSIDRSIDLRAPPRVLELASSPRYPKPKP